MKKIVLTCSLLFGAASFLCAQIELKETKIGNQTWMAENLNVKKFRNGDAIPEAKTDEEWKNAGLEGRPVWSHLNNQGGNQYVHGRIYNWYAVNDPRGLAPEGWHIASDTEWATLEKTLGSASKLKNKDGWIGDKASNESGFSAQPGGLRDAGGPFNGMGKYVFYWTSTEKDSKEAWVRALFLMKDKIELMSMVKRNGFYVRCVKD